jgi:hypothetical protein
MELTEAERRAKDGETVELEQGVYLATGEIINALNGNDELQIDEFYIYTNDGFIIDYDEYRETKKELN